MKDATHPDPGEDTAAVPDAIIAEAAARLDKGEIVALPTETVYGLAARADDAAAVARIYAAKGRPSFNPLIVHVPDGACARRLVHVGHRAALLMDRFWPGPLTLVLPARDPSPLAPAVRAGLPTIAVRCPAHPVMRAVLARCAAPLAAPSANRSGGVSPTCAAHVRDSLGENVPMIVDGGPTRAGLESTIVAIRDRGWSMLRPGPVTGAAIAGLLGPATGERSTGIEAPGQLSSHYAPGKPVRLNASHAEAGEFLIGFGAVRGDFDLSPGGDLVEAGSRLYDALHRASHAAEERIAVAPIPDEGIGAAINDRLRRAAF
ncbi:L-threonylcarbamoyladenylate synthase [Croceicoccus sp. YJ47]|uniref:L-threonylcarbamoyladenylate synthase n=1 Tax=Croceicoccus sp. YJ47 TaxID=2798724 RepID=UPI001923CCEE|nr:L-threonylcarbamoyladenylate synthase [Croceicoccus sp. YJ47]QQN75429.1 threonylcarbamoyl-AMP synthase [Croceicoccus sp. YJ47]